MININSQVNTLGENFEILVEKARVELFKGYQLKKFLESVVYFPGLLTSISNFSIATISAYITLIIISEILDKPFYEALNNSHAETPTPESLTYFLLTFRVNLKEVSEKNRIAVDLKVTGILRFTQNDNFELLGGQRTPKSQNIIAFWPKIWALQRLCKLKIAVFFLKIYANDKFLIATLLLFQISGFWLWVKPIWLVLRRLISSQKQELPTFITFFLWGLCLVILSGITQFIPSLWFESSIKLYHNHFTENKILWVGLYWIGFFPFITYIICLTLNFIALLIDIIILQNPKTKIKQVNSFIDKPLISSHNLTNLSEKELNGYKEFSVTHRDSIEKILILTSLGFAILTLAVDIFFVTEEGKFLINKIIEILKSAQDWQALILGFILGLILGVINFFLSLIWDSFHILIAHNFLQETFAYLKISREYQHPVQNQIPKKYFSKYKLIASFVFVVMIFNCLKKYLTLKNK